MKYVYLTIIYFGLLLSTLEYYARRVIGRIDTQQDFNEFIAEHNLSKESSPEDISEALISSFTWRADRTLFGFLHLGYPKHPLVFLHDRRDDCEGYTLFAEKLLTELGFDSVFKVFSINHDGRGHAVCVAKIGNRHYAFGNWPVILLPSPDTEDVGRVIIRAMKSKLYVAIRFEGYKYVDYVRCDK